MVIFFYNVALLVQNYPAFAFRSERIEARFLALDTKVAFLDLRFVVTESAGAIVLECEANAELFERSTADLLLAGLRDVLEQMIAAVSSKDNELSSFKYGVSTLEQNSSIEPAVVVTTSRSGINVARALTDMNRAGWCFCPRIRRRRRRLTGAEGLRAR